MISSVFHTDAEFLTAAMGLYRIDQFDMDPTYSKGNLYKSIPEPWWKSDINPPEGSDAVERDCRETQFPDKSLKSIVFDPPFLAGGGESGIMNERFSSYRSFSELWNFYRASLLEFFRVLDNGGFLFFKCQDCANARTQYFSHCAIYNMARGVGFYAKDLAIIVSNNRMPPPNLGRQEHFRKHHCYWWVLQKSKITIVPV